MLWDSRFTSCEWLKLLALEGLDEGLPITWLNHGKLVESRTQTRIEGKSVKINFPPLGANWKLSRQWLCSLSRFKCCKSTVRVIRFIIFSLHACIIAKTIFIQYSQFCESFSSNFPVLSSTSIVHRFITEGGGIISRFFCITITVLTFLKHRIKRKNLSITMKFLKQDITYNLFCFQFGKCLFVKCRLISDKKFQFLKPEMTF